MRLGIVRLLGILSLHALAAAAFATPAITLEACDGVHATVLHTSAMQQADARAVWLNGSQIRWPQAAPAPSQATQFKLYFSARGGLQITLGKPVRGADAAIGLSAKSEALAPEFTARFGYLEALGVTLLVSPAEQKLLSQWQRGQLMLVQESRSGGDVIDATALQSAGYLDDVFAKAATIADFVASVFSNFSITRFSASWETRR